MPQQSVPSNVLTAEAKGSLSESKKSSVVPRRTIGTAMMPIEVNLQRMAVLESEN